MYLHTAWYYPIIRKVSPHVNLQIVIFVERQAYEKDRPPPFLGIVFRGICIFCLFTIMGFVLFHFPSPSMAQQVAKTATIAPTTPLNTPQPTPDSPDPTATPALTTTIPYDPASAIPKWIPEDEIPICEANVHVTAEMAAVTAEIDYGAAPRCRIEEVPFEVDPDRPIIPPGRFWERSESEQGKISAASADSSTYAYVGPLLNCPTCGYSNPFITSLYYIVSAQPISLKFPNWGWSFYHVSGRAHLATDVPISCNYHGTTVNTYQNVSFGHVMGNTAAGNFTGQYEIFYEDFIDGQADCSFHDTGYTVASNAAVYYNIYTTGSGSSVHFIGRVWLNGAWSQVFDKTLTKGANIIDATWEMAAKWGDTGTIKVPLNYTQKIRASFGSTIYPLHETVLPSYAKGPSILTDPANPPWLYMDKVTDDHTAVGAMANQ